MPSKRYRDYIHSPAWRKRLMDLVYLCGDCHSATHELLKHSERNNNTTLWGVARKLRKIIRKRGRDGAYSWAYRFTN